MKTKQIIAVMITSLFLLFGCSGGGDEMPDQSTPAPTPTPTPDNTPTIKTEIFSFTTNGEAKDGKIYLPESYETNASLPSIYLIDFTDQHWEVVTDEFEKVVEAVKQISGLDALVVTLNKHHDIDAKPEDHNDYYTIFADMSSYVDNNYTNNTSRTFIARGSEAGIVLMTMFLEPSETSVFDNFVSTDSPPVYNSEIIKLIESGDFPPEKGNKKLHFSFSSSNDADSCMSLIKKINEAEYSWLQFESTQYSTVYPATYPTSYAAGLAYIFKD